MNLFDKIDNDLRIAIKDGKKDIVATLRMLKSDIMYEKTKGSSDLSEDKVLEIVNRAAKKRKEAIVEYEKASRSELAEAEKSELEIITAYLPKQLSEDEISVIIKDKLKNMGDINKGDFGRIMGPIMKDLKGKADGTLVKKVLTSLIEQ